MIVMDDFLSVRLSDIRGEANEATNSQLELILRAQNAQGLLYSGNTILAIERCLLDLYKQYSAEGADFIFQAAGNSAIKYISPLNMFSITMRNEFISIYERKMEVIGISKLINQSIDNRIDMMRSSLDTIRDRLIGDFRVGLAKGKRAVNDTNNSVSINNSTVGGQIIIAQNSNQNISINPDILNIIERILKPDELTEFSDEIRAEIRDAAETARDEIVKPNPDNDKLIRRLRAIRNFIASIGDAALKESSKQIGRNIANILSGISNVC